MSGQNIIVNATRIRLGLSCAMDHGHALGAILQPSCMFFGDIVHAWIMRMLTGLHQSSSGVGGALGRSPAALHLSFAFAAHKMRLTGEELEIAMWRRVSVLTGKQAPDSPARLRSSARKPRLLGTQQHWLLEKHVRPRTTKTCWLRPWNRHRRRVPEVER